MTSKPPKFLPEFWIGFIHGLRAADFDGFCADRGCDGGGHGDAVVVMGIHRAAGKAGAKDSQGLFSG